MGFLIVSTLRTGKPTIFSIDKRLEYLYAALITPLGYRVAPSNNRAFGSDEGA